MFEYMASGVPIVASGLPSIREVLNDRNAVLVKAGDSEALLKGVDTALNSAGAVNAERAREDVKVYTWDARAQSMKLFILSNSDLK